MFVDKAKIFIKAGDGGDGSVSFHREKYVASGGPDGGDGGRGGNVLFLADDNLSTLADFRYKRKYVAQKGENGKAKRSSGKCGNLLATATEDYCGRLAESEARRHSYIQYLYI